MTKSLGQIAFERIQKNMSSPLMWESLTKYSNSEWEAIAQEVVEEFKKRECKEIIEGLKK